MFYVHVDGMYVCLLLTQHTYDIVTVSCAQNLYLNSLEVQYTICRVATPLYIISDKNRNVFNKLTLFKKIISTG